MSGKRRRRVSKLIVRIKAKTKEDRKKAKIIEKMINWQMSKKELAEIVKIREQITEILINYWMCKDPKRRKEIEDFLFGEKNGG